ncbi:DNA cytosine methyltransferase [Devosia sediminis]|uniref:Cytosine-specific methyltransferase n=1 Tax=Devosia sediminis TaxID=2798801 RepID=A0A934IR48_9HYPH|nr:DNA cytosine methyltransferase [Devosia sediminis]MBJ3783651.1 DNA cytosine methyltransferase [Devosia sediminis]
MPTAVDIFCGSGGVTQGLRSARWRVLAACDNDPVATATYRANHPRTKLVDGDIRLDDTIDRIASAVRGRAVDLLVICAPCQPFSSQNRHRGDDEREQLIVRALAVAERLKPAMVFFENVPGLATPTYASIVAQVRTKLDELGYVVSDPLLRDAADFGVPQRRRRCIMLAARTRDAVDTFVSLDMTMPRKTVFRAIADLERLESGQASAEDALHRARTHQSIAVERLRHIPADGGSRSSLPAHLELRCHVGKPRSFSDVYGRMAWQDVAPTLTTGCTDITRGRFAHPEQHRAITLREAARLQSFPNDYEFRGNDSDIARQIGNAVPPEMIKAFVPAFRAALKASQR